MWHSPIVLVGCAFWIASLAALIIIIVLKDEK